MMMMITRKNLENEEEVNKTNTQIDKEANRNINAISVQIKRITTTKKNNNDNLHFYPQHYRRH